MKSIALRRFVIMSVVTIVAGCTNDDSKSSNTAPDALKPVAKNDETSESSNAEPAGQPSEGSAAAATVPGDHGTQSTEVEVSAGARAYELGMCYKCHGKSGKGSPRAPDLTDQTWVHCDGSVEGIRKVLITGVPKQELKNADRPFAMNPVTNLVKDDAVITTLAEYVHSLSQ